MRPRPWHAAPLALLAVRLLSAASAAEPSDSLYQLKAPLVAQDGREIGLDVYRGMPVLVTMFYASCQATCPLIIDTLRSVEKKLPPEKVKNLRVLLVSIDPEHDMPAFLAATARERRIDLSRWTLARADERTVRQIAAALSVQYRQLPDGQYSHATQISVLDSQGKVLVQSDRLGGADERLVEALKRQ